MSQTELQDFNDDQSWKRLPTQIYKPYHYVPSKVTTEERYIAVYSGAKMEKMVKANHPKQPLNNSLASASTVSRMMNTKYVNGLPLNLIKVPTIIWQSSMITCIKRCTPYDSGK